MAFGALDRPNHFEWYFGTCKNRFRALYYRADGYLDEYTEPIPFAVETGRVYDLEIRVMGRGRRITCLLNGEVAHDVTSEDRPEPRFSATAVRDSATGAVHVKIVNATERTVQASLEVGSPSPAATATVLAAPPDAGSVFESAPAVPVHTELDLAQPVTLEPYSFTVVSLRTGCDRR